MEDIKQAYLIFNTIPVIDKENIAVINAMLHAYFINDYYLECIELYKEYFMCNKC